MDRSVIDSVDKLADKYGVEDEAAFAVFDVESAGVAFWNVNGKLLPAIRFEGHYFYARLNDEAQRNAAVAQGLASPKAGAVKNPTSFGARYALLERAKAINPKAALESVSWGLGQVMGANWDSLGYASVDELVKAAQTVDGQVEMVFKFIQTNGLIDDLNRKDWLSFAKVYNGPKQKGYDKKLAAAYAKYSGTGSPKDDEIILMQKMLNAVGDYKLKLDGVNGNDTKAAIRDFQLRNGLLADGLYGPITRAQLEKVYLKKTSEGNLQVGAGGMGVGTIGTTLAEAAKGLQGMAATSQVIQWVFVGLIVAGAAFTAWSIWKNMKATKID